MDINKLIQDNLLISLIVIIVPIVAVAWKIMETLFIKPREFRINTLEQDLDKLRIEFLKIENQQGEKIEQEESKQSKTKIVDKEDAPQIIKVENQQGEKTEQEESKQSKTKIVDKENAPQIIKVENQQGEKTEQEESKQSKTKIVDKENASQIIKVENQILSSKHINTLQELYSVWRDKNITDLQRKRIEDTFSGKEVVWDVFVLSISEPDNGMIFLTIIHDYKELHSNYALAYFDLKDEETLALIGKGEKIRIKGTIDRFFLMPILKDCKLLNRLKE